MLAGTSGKASSKRGVMIWLLMMFTFLVIYNTFTGKAPQTLYSDQLFQLLCLSLVTVFGEKWLNAWLAMKGKAKPDAPPDTPVK